MQKCFISSCGPKPDVFIYQMIIKTMIQMIHGKVLQISPLKYCRALHVGGCPENRDSIEFEKRFFPYD